MAPTPFPSAGVPYPLTAACQQLCTIALISRGYTSQHYGAGVNAGGSNGLPLYQSGGGRWVNNAAWLNPDEALKQPPPDGVAPGAVYEWTPATGPNTDGSHIAFVLRAHRPGAGQGSWNGIQFFDTGGVAIPNRASGVTVRTDGKGNYDDPWAVQPFSGPAAFTGIGILPVSSPQAPDLQTAVNHMRMAWPLGFARILVRLRAGNQLLYASPLLSMCTANSSCNFSIARYLWSLREMPGRKDLDVRWQVSIPAGRLADTMLNASRATQLSTMLQSIQVSISPDRPLGGDPDPKHAGQALIKSLVELSVDPAGQVHLLSQLAQRAESLAWGSESGALAPPAANCLQVYPHYYKGVVITA